MCPLGWTKNVWNDLYMRAPSQTYSFAGSEAAGLGIPGADLDNQFFNHQYAIEDVQALLSALLAADGAFKPGVIKKEALDPAYATAIVAAANGAAAASAASAAASASTATTAASTATTKAAQAANSAAVCGQVYLGARGAPPATDLNGDPLQQGATYYDTTLQAAYVYGGASVGWKPITLTGAAGAGVNTFNSRTGSVSLLAGDVLAALGYAPYSAANPNGYISSVTLAAVIAALGYTPANKVGETFTGRVSVSPVSGAAQFFANSAVGNFSEIGFSSGASPKWFVSKDGNDDFYVYDVAAPSDVEKRVIYALKAGGALAINRPTTVNANSFTLSGNVSAGWAGVTVGNAGTGVGSSVFFNGSIRGVPKGGVEIVDYGPADGGAETRVTVTPTGTDTTDRRVVAATFSRDKQAWFTNSVNVGSAVIKTDGDIWLPWLGDYLSNTPAMLRKTGVTFSTNDGRGRLLFQANDFSCYRGGASGQWSHVFQTADATTRWLMNGNGDLMSAGNVIAYWSDERLKENVVGVHHEEGLRRVLDYAVVDYSWNEKGRELNQRPEGARERGLIAQQVQSVNPEAVAHNELAKDENGEPYLTVRENKLIFDLIGAVQALHARVRELEEALDGRAA